MKAIANITSCLIILSSLGTVQSAHAEERKYSLEDCFQLALARSNTVALTTEQINQVEAQIHEAQANYYPTLSLQASSLRQAPTSNALAQSLVTTPQNTGNVNFSQNLFQGFKDLASVRQKKMQYASYELAKKQALAQLYKDTAQAFYSVLSYQSDLKNFKEQLAITEKRRLELSSARKSGRARESDIVTVESAAATLEASIASTQGLQVSAQETLTYLTGLSAEAVLLNELEIPENIPGLDLWLENLDQRPDLLEAKQDIEVAHEGIAIAKAGYMPTLALNANYYAYRPPGLYDGVNWDTTMTLSFPIFSGGLTKAQVSEANAVKNSKEISYRQAKEQSVQSVRTIYRTLQSDLEQVKRLAKAEELSKRSFLLLTQDNRRGNATNTDVLTALATAQEAKRSVDRQRMSAIYDYIRLQVDSAKKTFDQIVTPGELK